MFDGEAFGREIVAAVRGYVDQATSALKEEISALRGELQSLQQQGSQTASAIAELRSAKLSAPPPDTNAVREIVREMVAALPPPEPGTPGKDADMAEVERMVAEAVAAIPKPKDGDPGKDVDPAEVQAMVADAVAKAVADIPKPKDGENGVGVAGALIDRDGALVLTLSDGKTCNLGRVVGEDGKSAVGDVDFEAELQGDGRTVTLRFVQGDVAQAYDLTFPVTIDAGVYRDGQDYQKGDGVTWAGSYWIAQRETKAKPGEGDDWRLSVKRGRDGRDVPQEKRVAGPVRVGVPKEAAQ